MIWTGHEALWPTGKYCPGIGWKYQIKPRDGQPHHVRHSTKNAHLRRSGDRTKSWFAPVRYDYRHDNEPITERCRQRLDRMHFGTFSLQPYHVSNLSRQPLIDLQVQSVSLLPVDAPPSVDNLFWNLPSYWWLCPLILAPHPQNVCGSEV
jgi:hypothetical protein